MELQLPACACVIRPLSPSDAVAVQRYANNQKIWINLRDAFPHPYTLDDARTFLGRVVNEKPATTFAIGGDWLHRIADWPRRSPQTTELGYWLGGAVLEASCQKRLKS
jgi:ribosomal-protein-alanine N-acetyltransferase